MGLPAWAQIEEDLARRIECLDVGIRLPPERDLAGELGVSRSTVRQALGSLAGRGLVERGVGRGTFVARPKVELDLRRVAGFTARAQQAGLTASARVVEVSEQRPPDAVRTALALEGEATALRVRRVRSAGGLPLVLEDSWLPADPFRALTAADLRGSLYAAMGSRFGAEPVRAVERLEPVLARGYEAGELGVARGAPLMLVERTAWDAADRPVEFARDLHRGDRARFVVEVRTGGTEAIPDG
jgi:GntR family transcriptional regulator